MEQIQLAEPVQGTSLVKLVEGIGQESELPFKPEREKYLRTMISSTIKHKFPKREYSVNMKEDRSAVIVSRGKDLESK